MAESQEGEATMNRDRIAADIAPGSTWLSESSAVRVVSVCSGYVRYMDGQVLGMCHHDLFRREFSRPYDARHIRSWFAMCLNNLAEFHAYYSPSRQRTFARSVTRQPEEAYAASRGSPALPADAVYVRTYADPATPNDFIQDLNDVLACHVARHQPA